MQAPASEDLDPYCVTAAESDRLLTNAPWHRFAAIGDSLAAGTGDAVPGYLAGPWAERVAVALWRHRSDLEYVNTGRVGATTAQTYQRQVPVLDKFAADLIFLSSGANDIWRTRFDPRAIEESLHILYETVAAPVAGSHRTVFTFTLGDVFDVPSIDDFPQRVQWLNEHVRTIAAATGVAVIEMWAHPIMDRPNLLSADDVHFTAMGQAVMASEVIKHLGSLLGTS